MNTLIAALSAFAMLSVPGPEGDALVKQIEAIKYPAWVAGKEEDKTYMDRYMKERAAATKQKNDLILQLYKKDPTHPKTVPLMRDRWREFESGNLGNADAYLARVTTDIDAILKTKPSKEIVAAGEAAKLRNKMAYSYPWTGGVKEFQSFIAKYPKSEEGAELLLISMTTLPQSDRPAITKLFLENYPNHPSATLIRGAARLNDAIGKPFELKFTEAISGKPFDIASLKGKVVVVDFWATWCGPCVAKMPELKATLDKYRSQGMEVIGVSLDQPETLGGLKALKEFVATKGYPWPQYYQGNGWDSEFSKSWGIMSIPSVFLIDRKGNLRKTGVNDLESSVKELLAESK